MDKLKGQNVTIDALRDVYIDANNVWADISKLAVKNETISNVYKKKIVNLSSKAYQPTNPVSQADILKGIVIFVASGSAIPTSLDQNPYNVDSSTGYDRNGAPYTDATITYYGFPNNVFGGIKTVTFPTSAQLDKVKVNESVDFSIVNNGNSSLRLVGGSGCNISGHEIVYDATSALFKVLRTDANTYYVIRLA